MRLKLRSVITLGALLWLAWLSPAIQRTQAALADGPSASADPISGPLSQPFMFSFAGLQPYTRLTLSFLPPGAGAFIVVDTPVPVVTDGFGQAVVPLSVVSLLGDSPADPGLLQLALLAGLVNVVWAQVNGGIAYFRFDACDTLNCADLVATVTPNGGP